MPSACPESTATANHRPSSTLNNPNKIDLLENPIPNPRDMPDPNRSSVKIEGWEEDAILGRSKFLHRMEVLKRRHRRTKQLQRIYRDFYWGLMEEVKHKHREYCWKYGKSTFAEDDQGNNTVVDSNCGVEGCNSKAMALTRFCHMHILCDPKQKLYKPCNYAVKSSPTGPILCGGKPILRSTVPSYCSIHSQKAEKDVNRALRKAGINVSKVAPKFHVIVAEYVNQIQRRRRAAQKASLDIADIKEEKSP